MADKELVMELEEDISWLEQGCTTEKEICEHIKQAIKTIIHHKETENPWHTGTPTEEGWYLVAYECIHECRNKGKLEYFTMHILEDEFGYKDIRGRASDDVWKAVAWMPIEPFKED